MSIRLHEPTSWTTADEAAARLMPAWLSAQGAWATVKDLETGRYLAADAGLAERLGLAGGMVGRTDAELFDASVAAVLRAADQAAAAQGAAMHGEHHVEVAGRRHELQLLRLAYVHHDRALLAAIWRDAGPDRAQAQQLRAALEQIEQLQRDHDRLRREMADQALRDPASGLHRRPHFEEQLRRELDLSQREQREFSLVFLEMDPPSPKVSGLGPAGERALLEAMGRLLRGGTRAMDAAGHWGDRRFAVLLSGVGLATAHSRMEGLRRKCAAQLVVQDGQEFGFTVSVGVASFPHTAHAQEALLEACQAALLEARRRGGNTVALAAIRFDAA